MKIILHAGAHRTATTNLQRMMGQAGPRLDRAMIAYWGPKRTRSGLFHGLLGHFDLTRPWELSCAQDRIRKQAARLAENDCRTLFVSEENMIGTLRHTFDIGRLYPDAGARMARVADAMNGHDITVGLAVRDYVAWWTSALAFRLPRGGPVPHAAFCAGIIAEHRGWRDIITDVARALPNARIVVWSHERKADVPGAVVDSLLNRRMNLLGTDAHRNPMPSAHALRAYMDDCGHDPGLIKMQGARFMPFDAAQRAIMRARYAEDMAWLADGSGGLADYLPDPSYVAEGGAAQGKGLSHDAPPRSERSRKMA